MYDLTQLVTMLEGLIDLTDASPEEKEILKGLANVLVQLERAKYSGRIKAGLMRARLKGHHIGRPSTLTPEKIQEVCDLLDQGVGMCKIGRIVRLGSGTVQKIARQRRQKEVMEQCH